MGGAVNSSKDGEASQRDLDKLGGWAVINNIKSTKSQCQILCLEWGGTKYVYRIGDERLESSPMERNLGFWLAAS